MNSSEPPGLNIQPMKHEFQFFTIDEEVESMDLGEMDSDFDDSEFGDPETGTERVLKVRLDKWLWAARFFKTRALARAAVEAGKVFYNGERSKPSREIEIGALLQIRQGRFEKTVTVKGLSTRRRSTDEALQLFEESEESRNTREQLARDFPVQPYFPQNYHHGQGQSQGYSPYGHSPYGNPYPEQRERRSVRFLRRSFQRNGEQKPIRNTGNMKSDGPYPEYSDSELETFE